MRELLGTLRAIVTIANARRETDIMDLGIQAAATMREIIRDEGGTS